MGLLVNNYRSGWLAQCWGLALLFLVFQASAQPLLRIGTFTEQYNSYGREARLVAEAAEALGYKLEFVIVPAQRSLVMAASGALDGELLRQPYAVEGYPTLRAVDVALLKLDYWLWVSARRACPQRVQAIESLKPVGVLGFKYFDHIYRLSRVGFEQATSVAGAMRMLRAGRGDYIAAVDAPEMHRYAQESQLRLKKCLQRPLLSLSGFFYLHEKHALLIPEFERLLTSLIDQEEVQ